MTGPRRAIVAAFVLMAAPLLYTLISFAARSEPQAPWLEPARPGTTCILPKASMRLSHGSHLKNLRDQVVREGRRDALGGDHPQGITSCRGCHAKQERFCDRCHERASVRLDCFGCHVY